MWNLGVAPVKGLSFSLQGGKLADPELKRTKKGLWATECVVFHRALGTCHAISAVCRYVGLGAHSFLTCWYLMCLGQTVYFGNYA
jgi:hypothetical protein